MEVGEYDTLVDGHHSRRGFLQRFKFPLIALVILLIALGIVFGVVWSARMHEEDQGWDAKISVANIMGHLQQLQNIADLNNGNRAANTSGYAASIDYILGQLKKTNYNVEVQDFNYSAAGVVSASNITIYGDPQTFNVVYGVDYGFMGAGPTTDHVINNASVYLAVGYGCTPDAYAGIPPNSAVLVVRGNCSFDIKVNAAESVQPSVVIVYNEGNTPDRVGPFFVSVGNINTLALSVSYYTGLALIGSNFSFSIQTSYVIKITQNIIADTKVGLSDRVVVVGSHLDSVPAGPGINDNGSGSALNIELALLLSSSGNQKKLKNKVRFCWFGAEELGLLGSHAYVNFLNLTNPQALANISVNLNFDMVGSPNFIRGVYNGSSDTHIGSHVVQRLFNNYYASKNIAVIPTPFTGRSDYGPFLGAGIPAGGLFTGAEEIKSIPNRKLFGGLAGAWYDPCYHQACDTIDNIDQGVLQDMSAGAAKVLEQLVTASNLTTFLQTLPAPVNATSSK